MAASVDDPKVLIQLVPSLSTLALVKIAVPVIQQFDNGTLEKAFTDIQEINPTASDKNDVENSMATYKRVEDNLLTIPRHLRMKVWESVVGLQYGAKRWKLLHADILGSKEDEFTFYWRFDGTIDATKTAQGIVLNENIHIRIRFAFACNYCFEKSIQTLWAEMEASGEAENFDSADNCKTRFWIRWMREGSKVPWTQAAGEYLELRDQWFVHIPWFSSFFPLLPPKDRQKFLQSVKFAQFDDLRMCIYSLTKEEEKTILKDRLIILRYLFSFLNWPLQNLFLEAAEKLWDYIDVSSFVHLISYMLTLCKRYGYDYSEIMSAFWNGSPIHFREKMNEYQSLIDEIDSYNNQVKRKSDCLGKATPIKKMRPNASSEID